MIKLQRILVPTDFSEYSAEAIVYACALADKFGAKLHFLHALECHTSSAPLFGGGIALTPRLKETREAVEQELNRAAPQREAVRVTGDGPAFRCIVSYAEDNDIDLIVMGTHGRSGAAHVVMGSVAERVVRGAPCPVLTIRHPKREHAKSMEECAEAKPLATQE